MQESSVQSDSGVTDIQPAEVTDLADVPKVTDRSDSPKVTNLADAPKVIGFQQLPVPDNTSPQVN